MGINRAYTGISDLQSHLGNGSQVNVGGDSRGPFAFDNALLHDGVNDNHSFASALGFATNQPFTINKWIKPNDTVNATLWHLETGGNKACTAWFLGSDRKLKIECFENNIVQVASDNALESNNAWMMITLTFDGTGVPTDQSKFSLYVNSTLQTSTYTSFFTNVNNVSVMGALNTGGGSPLAYTADEFAVWTNYEASQAEINSLYNSGNGDYADDVISSPTAYLRYN